MSVQSAILSVTTPNGPLIDPKTGQATFAFTKFLQALAQVVNTVFTSQTALSSDAIPTPTSMTRGGVLAGGPQTHEWVDSIDNTGKPTLSQPAFSDLQGMASSSQIPPVSSLSGSVSPSQVPALSQISGSVTAAQVPSLDQLSGQITDAQLPSGLLGISGTFTLAKLTVSGSTGSLTFVDGILKSGTDAT